MLVATVPLAVDDVPEPPAEPPFAITRGPILEEDPAVPTCPVPPVPPGPTVIEYGIPAVKFILLADNKQ